MAKIEEFEDPTSRYQNPRYSGKKSYTVPDRSNHPKRKGQQFSSSEYEKLRKGKVSDSIHGDDSGISQEYMEKLNKQLRKRP